jgi:hypothetical protein
MPVPSVATYSAAALVAAHTTFRDLIDAGSGAGLVRLRDAADVLLASIPFDDPCGTVNGTTGQLVFAVAAGETTASNSGTVAYGELCDSAGVVHLALPAQSGTSPVAGRVVLNSLLLVSGGPVTALSVTLG